MGGLLTVTLLGLLLGMRHAADADHVVAVATIVSRQRSVAGAAIVGLLWGIGHTITIVVVGAAIIVFGLVIPPRLGLAVEFSVALMLIALGALNLGVAVRRLRTPVATEGVHSHAHPHGDYVHTHPHAHEPGNHGHAEHATPQAWLDRTFGRLGAYQVLRPIVVGLVHGLAGSAAVALLVLAAIPDPVWATVYLVVFGLGTILGMMLITVGIALPVVAGSRWRGVVGRWSATASGLVSLGFGLALAYQIGVVDGLFVGEPQWRPE
jgi:cytochrome c biogenesis protein CcdA